MSNIANKLVANIFKALSHPIRLRIVRLLKTGSLCVCDILANLESEQSNTSQHLSVLKNNGIVDSHKDGSKVIYSIKSTELYELIDIAESIIITQLEETYSILKK